MLHHDGVVQGYKATTLDTNQGPDSRKKAFVLSRMVNPPVGVQLYPDRGPRTRAKGQGKGRGGGKGKDGKGKGGKGKGKKGGKAKADRAGDVEMES